MNLKLAHFNFIMNFKSEYYVVLKSMSYMQQLQINNDIHYCTFNHQFKKLQSSLEPRGSTRFDMFGHPRQLTSNGTTMWPTVATHYPLAYGTRCLTRS